MAQHTLRFAADPQQILAGIPLQRERALGNAPGEKIVERRGGEVDCAIAGVAARTALGLGEECIERTRIRVPFVGGGAIVRQAQFGRVGERGKRRQA